MERRGRGEREGEGEGKERERGERERGEGEGERERERGEREEREWRKSGRTRVFIGPILNEPKSVLKESVLTQCSWTALRTQE